MTKGDRIHQLRLAKGLTMEELGKKVGVSKPTIKRYEAGIIDNIPSDKIEAIANALETTPAYIMGWDEQADPASVEADEDIYDIREELRRNPQIRALFGLARRADPNDVRAAIAMLKALEGNRDE